MEDEFFGKVFGFKYVMSFLFSRGFFILVVVVVEFVKLKRISSVRERL